ncbi:MAG TPA: HAD-IIB family hydrolase [Gammaproteobacteria bacterium]|nr:HAD-IIB family hydrolase [Gammaproteobacteria bacterium]
MTETILLCTDLDRTVLPNGHHPESANARALFSRLVSHEQLLLVYVSGRDERLLHEAIARYSLPEPDFAIGDVGSTIFETTPRWHAMPAWHEEIAPDWGGADHEQITRLFNDLEILRLQEPEKQGRFKVSYYLPADTDTQWLLPEMERRLQQHGIHANLIWSIDDIEGVGLLDILPRSANKLHAIQFLRRRLDIPEARTVFAGDSGNDLPVLCSGLQSILVANAREDVRQAALHALEEQGLTGRLYLAKGGFMGLNGNYAAGVVEGVAHYFPETRAWIGAPEPSP